MHDVNVLDELQGAVAVAEGGFTLDRDKAREKLRHFQLADPCAWLLEVVRSAVAANASQLEVQTDADDVRISFDAAYTLKDIEELYDALLAQDAPPPRQHLAVALNGAMALAPRFIKLESASANGDCFLEMRPGEPDRYGERDAGRRSFLGLSSPTEARTEIWVRDQFRAGHFVEFFRARMGTQKEIRAVTQACRFASIDVTLNGKRVSVGLSDQAPQKKIREPHAEGFVTLTDPESPGALLLLHRSVVLEELGHPMLPYGVLAVVEGKAMRRDASLNAFLRGPAFESLLDATLTKAAKLVEREPSESAHIRLARALGSAIPDLAKTTTLKSHPRLHEFLSARSRPMRTAHLFVDHAGKPLSLNALCAELEIHKNIAVVRRQVEGVTPWRALIQIRDDDEEALLTAIVGDKKIDGENVLKLAIEKSQRLARLRARRAPTALAPDQYFARTSFGDGPVRGELGLRRGQGPAGIAATFFVDGCLAATHVIPCPIPYLSMAIEAPFALNDTLDDVVRDETFVKALRVAFASLPQLFESVEPDTRATMSVTQFAAWALDPEGVWRAFTKELGARADVKDLPALPTISLKGKNAHAIVNFPMFVTVDGDKLAMKNLGARIPVVPPEVVHADRKDAIRAGEVVRALLAKLGQLEILDEVALRQQRRAEILAQAPPRIVIGGYEVSTALPAGKVKVRLDASSLESGVTVDARLQGRSVDCVHLKETPVGPVLAHVDDPDLLPLESGGLAPSDAARLAVLALSGAPDLLIKAPLDTRTRRLALSLLTALFPRPAYRRALDAFKIGVVLDIYLKLLELGEHSGHDEVATLIDLCLEAGDTPTVSELRRFAQTVGVELKAGSASTQLSLSMRLAPFGGREGLLKPGAGPESGVLRRIVACARALGTLPFRTLDGGVKRVDDMIDMDVVRYTARESANAEDFGGVVVLSPAEHAALSLFLGEQRLKDVTEELRRAIAREKFAAKRVESVQLDPAAHAWIVEIKDGAVRGQLGLLPTRQGETEATVRILKGGREVSRHDLSATAACSFAAVIDDPELPMLADFSAPSSPGRVAHLFALAVRAAEQAIDQLATNLETARARNDRAHLCVIQRLAARDQHGIDARRFGALATQPLFVDVNNEWTSLNDMLAEIAQGRHIGHIQSAPREPPPEKRKTIIVRTVAEKQLLSKVLNGAVVDVEPLWAQLHRLQARKARLGALPVVPNDALAVHHVDTDEIKLRVYVPYVRIGKILYAGAEGLAVSVVHIETLLPSVSGSISGATLVDPDWQRVDLSPVKDTIDAACARLALSLAATALKHSAHGRAAREECRTLLRRLSAQSTTLTPRWTNVLNVLTVQPLFEVADGTLISLKRALADRPASLEELLVHYGFVERIAATAPESSTVEAPDRSAAKEAPEPVVLSAPPPPKPKTAEELLQERIIETLALVHLDNDAKAEFARWPIHVGRFGGKHAVKMSKRMTMVDADHALVRQALDGNDHAAFFMLCAIVYGAVNTHLVAVTDEHERAFLARLITHVSARR